MDEQLIYSVIADPGTLSGEHQELLHRARKSTALAYAPYSGFLVGASLLLDNQVYVQGANQENVAYPLCMCAERVACYSASMLYPGAKIMSAAVHVKSVHKAIEKPAAPCGACRQVMQEYVVRQGMPFSLFLSAEQGETLYFETVTSLLPMGFTPDFLLDIGA